MGKPTTQPPQAPYRDEPDYAETASMSSAVLLGDVDFLDEELPSYSDTPSQSIHYPPPDRTHGYFEVPPELPFSTHDLSYSEFRTRFPNFSTSVDNLYQMIKEQADYPPLYYVELHGSHTETRRNGNKESKDNITDFHFRINITYLLGYMGTGKHQFLPDNKRGYRGTRIPSLTPVLSDIEGADNLRLWCEKYVADPSKVKSFTLSRKIVNHDTKKLEQLVRSAIASTNYRGHLSVKFPVQHEKVIVYSPGKINEWRITTWIRWFFYLTFLWIFAWPVLFFATSRYEVINSVWEYADTGNSNDPDRICCVMGEAEWFHRWESAIRRAALARMNCKDTDLDESYRDATAKADQRGQAVGNAPEIPRTGNAFADGALGFLGAGLRVAAEYNDRNGWGGDC